MYLAYSAFQDLSQPATPQKSTNNKTLALRYIAYRETCQKHKQEIIAIQKYLPGWQPAFNY
ncbi:MAG: hypothetical protein ACXVAY_00930 [Mucilaginibacter sp.]